MKKYHFTYQTKNLVNGKTYVGVHSTNNLNDGYIGSGILLQRAVKRYGVSRFTCNILCYFDTTKAAFEEERFLVDKKWVRSSTNYNLAIGGHGGSQPGLTHTEETKKRMSENSKGQVVSRGTRDKLSKALLGRKHTPEHRERNRQAKLGCKLGPMSEKRKRQNSIALKGKSKSEEHKKSLSKARKGKSAPNKGQKMPVVDCPHCRVSMSPGNAKRYHFDNCKTKTDNK